MTNFIEALSEASRKRWFGTPAHDGQDEKLGIYEAITGKKWSPNVADDRGVSCEVNIEPPEGYAEFMESNREVTR